MIVFSGILAGVDLDMPGSKGAFDEQVKKAQSSAVEYPWKRWMLP
jgi:hypothetical protein